MAPKTNLDSPVANWRLDAEQAVVARLVEMVAAAGITADSQAVVNVYVALKTKPRLLLVGLSQSGKGALVEALANVLMGTHAWRHQVMVGHAWWAGRSGNVALFTEAQARLNVDKIAALVEEARASKDAGCLFMACLSHISPAELMEFFTEADFQPGHRQRLPLRTSQLVEPAPYPFNFRLIGTMDSERLNWFDEDLLAGASVIEWRGCHASLADLPAYPNHATAGEKEFLGSCLCSEHMALAKLHNVLKGLPQPFAPLLQVENWLEKGGISLPGAVRREAVIYLANSWSQFGWGLFDRVPSHNLAMALDLAIGQIILPYAGKALRRSLALRRQLQAVLTPFPRSTFYLERFS